MATKGKGSRRSILDMIPDDLDEQEVEIPHNYRREPATEPSAPPTTAPPERAAEPQVVAAVPAVPAPRDPLGDSTELLPQEQADLEACEQAIDTLRLAFWAAGKALQTIRDGGLYRSTYDTFEAYCADRWEMTRRQADRLIAAWPLAERLRPIGLSTLNEGQVRELLPVAERHGPDAAELVYRTVTEADGVKVTASVLKGAVRLLPPDHFDPRAAAEQVRAYLTGISNGTPPAPPATPPASAAKAFVAETARVRAMVKRVAAPDALLAAAAEHPDQVRAAVTALRDLLAELSQLASALDQIEKQIQPASGT